MIYKCSENINGFPIIRLKGLKLGSNDVSSILENYASLTKDNFIVNFYLLDGSASLNLGWSDYAADSGSTSYSYNPSNGILTINSGATKSSSKYSLSFNANFEVYVIEDLAKVEDVNVK